MAAIAPALPAEIANEHRAVVDRVWRSITALVRKVESRLPDPEHLAPDAAWDSPKTMSFVVGGFGMP